MPRLLAREDSRITKVKYIFISSPEPITLLQVLNEFVFSEKLDVNPLIPVQTQHRRLYSTLSSIVSFLVRKHFLAISSQSTPKTYILNEENFG